MKWNKTEEVKPDLTEVTEWGKKSKLIVGKYKEVEEDDLPYEFIYYEATYDPEDVYEDTEPYCAFFNSFGEEVINPDEWAYFEE